MCTNTRCSKWNWWSEYIYTETEREEERQWISRFACIMISAINITSSCMFIPKSNIAHFNRKNKNQDWMNIESNGLSGITLVNWGWMRLYKTPHGDDKAYAVMHYWCCSHSLSPFISFYLSHLLIESLASI